MNYGFKTYVQPEILTNHLNLGGKDNKGNELSATSLYLAKNGKPYIGIMGELHFSRLPRSQWKEALTKMKAGGITIVSTYVIWIYHEMEEGKFDFTGDNDLRAFVEMADELGLEVVIRIGPWVHGEVRNGGLPDWLLEKPFKLRSLDADFMALVKRYYIEIEKQVHGLLFKDGGPINTIQIENELVDDADYLLGLKKLAIEVGLDVPFYTVTGWNSAAGARIPVDDVIPTFGGYCDAPWDYGLEQLPPNQSYHFTGIRNDSAIGKDLIQAGADEDGWQLPYEKYPYATCEIGGGLQNTYHRRYIIKGMDVYTMALIKFCEGCNLMGYYMYHGGLNKLGNGYTLQESKETNYPNDYPMISYDFQGPISSYEETRESYDLLNLLHLFIRDYEEKVATMTYVPSLLPTTRDDLTSLRYGMRGNGKSGFVFINHYQRLHKIAEVKDVVIDTGVVKFPSIDVKGEISFFMPFNMELEDGVVLEYATMQPLCMDGNKWYFMEIPGVKPSYKFATNKVCDIEILPMAKALKLRKVDGRVYFEEPEKLGDGRYTMKELSAPAFDIPDMFEKELKYDFGSGKVTWYEISVDDAEGFIDIDVKCDVMQLYVDGKLVDDDFYHNLPWRLPKRLIYGYKSYVVVSEFQDTSYME